MDLITTTHVGVMHGVRRQSVVRWINLGMLPAQRGFRGLWMVDRQVAMSFRPPVRKPRSPKYVGCEVPGCDRKHKARRMCTPHYERWLRMGTASPDKPIKRIWFKPVASGQPTPRPKHFDLEDTGEL